MITYHIILNIKFVWSNMVCAGSGIKAVKGDVQLASTAAIFAYIIIEPDGVNPANTKYTVTTLIRLCPTSER